MVALMLGFTITTVSMVMVNINLKTNPFIRVNGIMAINMAMQYFTSPLLMIISHPLDMDYGTMTLISAGSMILILFSK